MSDSKRLKAYRKEAWPDRWARKFGVRPDVVKVRHSGTHGAREAYEFRSRLK